MNCENVITLVFEYPHYIFNSNKIKVQIPADNSKLLSPYHKIYGLAESVFNLDTNQVLKDKRGHSRKMTPKEIEKTKDLPLSSLKNFYKNFYSTNFTQSPNILL